MAVECLLGSLYLANMEENVGIEVLALAIFHVIRVEFSVCLMRSEQHPSAIFKLQLQMMHLAWLSLTLDFTIMGHGAACASLKHCFQHLVTVSTMFRSRLILLDLDKILVQVPDKVTSTEFRGPFYLSRCTSKESIWVFRSLTVSRSRTQYL